MGDCLRLQEMSVTTRFAAEIHFSNMIARGIFRAHVLYYRGRVAF
jgi:hypothetical protein